MRNVRFAATLLAAAAVLLAAAPAAGAELRFRRCEAFLFPCARLSVPLDRSGATPGRVSLFVGRVRASRRPALGAVFVLAGGPGESASEAFGGDGLGLLAPALRHRDLIVFDQRGTGRSGLLRCPALEHSNLFDAGLAAGLCARRLGARRHHYTSRASVEDIEAIRSELGIPRITLYGTSYGVKVALGYALTYPGHVERLVLDSVVEPGGQDPLYRPSLAAAPRVLQALCRSRCRAFTRDPVVDLQTLVRRMAARPLRGYLVDRRGRRRRARLTRGELFLIFLSGDFEPALRAAFPGAVRAALDGDTAPLLRLGRRAISVAGEPPPPHVFSSAVFTATTCEESPLPWARTTPPDPLERRRQAEAAVSSTPSSAFLPFDRGAALENDLLRLCDRWAAAPVAPAFGPGPLPDVPVLLVEGEDDLRTPVENASRVARLFPQAQLVVAPGTGHSALSSDFSGCTGRALARFFRDQPLEGVCRREPRLFPAMPPPPRRLGEVGPLRAVALTVRDVAQDSPTQPVVEPGDPDVARGGGLRGGRYRLDGRFTLHLEDVVFVPGVRVSGFLRRFEGVRQHGRLRVRGHVRGTLRVVGSRVVGRIGGRRVAGGLALPHLARAGRRRPSAAPTRARPPITIGSGSSRAIMDFASHETAQGIHCRIGTPSRRAARMSCSW
jgi:pimeloyl-ACP methyl ester carboxylesterase